jgi:hypothetical protein
MMARERRRRNLLSACLALVCLTLLSTPAHAAAADEEQQPSPERRLGSTNYKTTEVAPADVVIGSDDDTSESTFGASRRLLDAFPSGAFPGGAGSFPGGPAAWTSCFPAAGAHRVSIGVAVDVGFYELFNSKQDVLNFIAMQFTIVNRIYLAQMSLQFVVGEILIMEEPGTYAWNHKPNPATFDRMIGVCDGATISAVLDDFTAWRRDERPTKMGLWHLFTNCFPPPGTVGLSWMGGLCQTEIGTGVSSFSSTFWLTLAHELGHNLGAQHSFQLGEGRTGGVMDYADGSYPLGSSTYQFVQTYSKSDMCGTISKALALSSSGDPFAPYCIDAANVYVSKCGNGIVEDGEQCDDDSDCCDQRTCLLGVGMQCSPGPNAVDGDSQCCQNCRFLPSTEKCNVLDSTFKMTNSIGYCSNGLCAISSCDDFYQSLSFCGLKADNPCRQTCLPNAGSSKGICTDGFTFPNMNLPAGTLCSLSPHSTCQLDPNDATKTMRCVSSALSSQASYAWVSGPWSTCLGECGTGSFTRFVSCIDASTGLAVSESLCAGIRPVESQPCQLGACPQYRWSEPVWSPCDTDCGTGLQQNRPRCLNYASLQPIVVPSSFCASLVYPPTQRACIGEKGAVCPVSWVYTGYSPCSKTCGGGVAVTRRTCVQTRNAFTYTLDDSECAGITAQAQPLQIECNTNACPAFYYSYSIWSPCSVTCGGGTQTRSATCIDRVTGNQAVDASKCADTSLNPLGLEATQQTCSTTACPHYGWVQSSTWSDCSVSCGGGESYSLIQCFDSSLISTANPNPNGVAVADQFCIATRPQGTRSCNTQTCPDYHYRSGTWSGCSANCNGGVMVRNVTCHNMQGVRMADCTLNSCPDVDSRYCTEKGLTAPPATAPCNQQPCFEAMWLTGDWGDCDQPCGGTGMQKRKVQCVSTNTYIPISESQCGGSRPADSQLCNTQSCAAYQYVPGAWTECDAACGGGSRTRGFTCIYGGAAKSVSDCAAAGLVAPATVGSCNTQSCATFWWTSDFGACSKACEYGTTTRQVECRQSTTAAGLTVPDDQCTSTKPASTAVCNVFPCPAWVTSDWKPCSVRCGDGGTKSRDVVCLSYDNNIVSNDQCVHNMPSVEEPCDLTITNTTLTDDSTASTLHQPCPHWHRSEWSDCTRPCGGGVQYRNLTCRMPHDSIYLGRLADDPALCPAGYVGSDAGPLVTQGSALVSPGSTADQSTPALAQSCNTDPCTANYWQATWGECNQPCGGGEQKALLECMSAADNSVIPSNLCLAPPPSSTRACNTDPCPTYEWFVHTEWSACSVHCDEGVQVREVKCRNTTPKASLMIPYELVSDSFCSDLPKPDTTQACFFSHSVCFGLGADGQERKGLVAPEPGKQLVNGICWQGRCLCRPGYGPGITNCDVAPLLSQMVMNSAQYNQLTGVPFGEAIQLTWQTSPYIPHIQILLSNDAVAYPLPFPQLLTSRLLNNGSVIWAVGNAIGSVASALANSGGTGVFGLPYGLGDGGPGWRLRIRFDDSIYVDSPHSMSLASPCGYLSCGTHGTCTSGGVCKCAPGWEGPQCQLSPCLAAKCGRHSRCIVGQEAQEEILQQGGAGNGTSNSAAAAISTVATVLPVGTAICQCTDGWSGSQCTTPPGCTPSCSNGGDFVVSGIMYVNATDGGEDCPTQCACMNSYSPASKCLTCGLICSNGGVPDSDCAECVCTPGWFGQQCQCKYYLLTLGFAFRNDTMPAMVNTSSWVSSSALLPVLSETLARDVSAAVGMGLGEIVVTVESVKVNDSAVGKVVMEMRIAKACATRAFHRVGGGGRGAHDHDHKIAASRRLLHVDGPQRRLLQVGNSTANSSSTSNSTSSSSLSSLWSSLSSQLGLISSDVYRGLLLGQIDPEFQASVRDPTGLETPEQPSKPRELFQAEIIDDTSAKPLLSLTLTIILSIIGGLLCFTAIAYSIIRHRHKSYLLSHNLLPDGSRRRSSTIFVQTTPDEEGWDGSEGGGPDFQALPDFVPMEGEDGGDGDGAGRGTGRALVGFPASLMGDNEPDAAADAGTGSRRVSGSEMRHRRSSTSRRGSHYITPRVKIPLSQPFPVEADNVPIGLGSLERAPAMPGMMLPRYSMALAAAASANASPAIGSSPAMSSSSPLDSPSGIATPSGILTPNPQSRDTSATSSAQVSRRGSLAGSSGLPQWQAHLLQPRAPASEPHESVGLLSSRPSGDGSSLRLPPRVPVVEEHASASASPELPAYPRGMQRGSFIQSIRIVNPNDTVVAGGQASPEYSPSPSPSPLVSEALLRRTFDHDNDRY